MIQNFVIVCESAVIDKLTNKLYLLGIFTDINTKGIPTMHPIFYIVTNFSGGEGKHIHKIIIKSEDNKEISKLEGEINFGPAEEGKNAQFIARFAGLNFPNYGTYHVFIYIDNMEQPLKAKINVKKA